MAKVKANSALSNLTGMIDGWVYRQVKGQTIVSSGPYREEEADPTPAQLAQRKRFKAANYYVVRVLADPCHRRVYEMLAKERNRRTDRMVASDYLTPPKVEHIELAGYHGRPADVIRVIATDDVEVVSVNVAISTAAGTRLEAGAAAKVHGVWNYPTTIVLPPGEKVTITATAKDRPGNLATLDVAYP